MANDAKCKGDLYLFLASNRTTEKGESRVIDRLICEVAKLISLYLSL